jgi:hypothetical protein
MSFAAPSTGTYYIKPNWQTGSYYTGYSMSLYEDIDTAGPKIVSQDPPNQGQAASLTANLRFTFNEDILRGSGTITLSHTGDTGNVVVDDVFDVANSNRISINGKVLAIDPTRDLDERYTYTVAISSGAVKDAAGLLYGGTQAGSGQGYSFSTFDVANHTYFGSAANEVFKGGPGFDTIDGGGGTDTAQYGGNYSLYKVTVAASSVTVADSRTTHASDNTDVLKNVERLQFADVRMALDLVPTLAGGEALLMLAAAVGAPALANKPLVGVFLNYFDAGFTVQDGATLLVDSGIVAAFAAGADNAAVVNYIYTNVNGHAPDAATLAALLAPLNAQALSQAQWLASVALSPANQTHVNLIGYLATGLQYTV